MSIYDALSATHLFLYFLLYFYIFCLSFFSCVAKRITQKISKRVFSLYILVYMGKFIGAISATICLLYERICVCVQVCICMLWRGSFISRCVATEKHRNSDWASFWWKLMQENFKGISISISMLRASGFGTFILANRLLACLAVWTSSLTRLDRE